MSKTIEVSDVIERGPLGASLWSLLTLCLLVVICDGFDAQIMGYVGPGLVKQWHLPASALGPLFSAGLFGLMLGALFLGTLGDRFGRKAIILTSVLLFGVFSLATAFSDAIPHMLVLRFLTGLGLGGAMPGAIALISEYTPKRVRGTFVTIVVTGFAIGPALGGLLAATLIPVFGWRSMFVVGGVVPLLLLPLLWWRLPESARLMIGRGESADKVARNLIKVFPRLVVSKDARFSHVEGQVPAAPVKLIFADGRAIGTVLLWLAIFLTLIGINLQTSWLPLMITAMGYPVATAAATTALFHFAGALGGLIISRLLDRLNYTHAVAAILVIASVMVVLIGRSGSSIVILRATIFGAGLFVVGGQCALNAMSGIFYPSFIRSTGSGWALGIGRMGAVVGPMIGAALLLKHFSQQLLFLVEAVPFFLAALAIAVIGLTRHGRIKGADAMSIGATFNE